jgi:hypothetical protein
MLTKILSFVWEDNIREGLRGIVWKVLDSMHVTQGKDQWQHLVNMIMNFRVP